jgi:hypothetical protein
VHDGRAAMRHADPTLGVVVPDVIRQTVLGVPKGLVTQRTNARSPRDFVAAQIFDIA